MELLMLAEFYISNIQFFFVIFSFGHQFQSIRFCIHQTNDLLLWWNLSSWNDFLLWINKEEHNYSTRGHLAIWSIHHFGNLVNMTIGKDQKIAFFCRESTKWKETFFSCMIYDGRTTLRYTPKNFISFRDCERSLKPQVSPCYLVVSV